MDKVKYELKTQKPKIIEYNNIDIEVQPFLGFIHQMYLIEEYIKYYFGQPDEVLFDIDSYHYIEAECRLMGALVQLVTNIDVTDINNDFYADTALWNKITESIINYEDFRNKLEKALQATREKINTNNSLGSVISNLAEKLNDYLDKISDMSPEDIENLKKSGVELIERLEKSSVLQNPADFGTVVEPIVEGTSGSPKKRGRPKKA